MDKTLALQAELRERIGSKAASAVRKQGRIPCIVYGHKEEPVAISVNAHDFLEGIHHGHRLVDITINGTTEKMLVKELQFDHLGRDIVHVDLMRVDVTEMITVDVPVEIKGIAKGTSEGGVVESNTDHLEIECLAINIPEKITVIIKDLGVGETIKAGDIKLPEGVKLVSSPEMAVVSCRIVAEAKTTEQLEAEAPAAPEVITEKAPKGEEEAE
ncbi:MAG TPA: 50S ribosomal protein L25 [Sedimentisphaerales bacterium]|nr:50S ribosomal protein L25 [Sedimentisphaerales bacterium]HQI27754.1 50S ribosomal protein L25 [Sedimentisphaerales bacterium]